MRVGSDVIEGPKRATEEIDLSALRRIVVERRKWILVPTLLAFVASAIFVNIVRPRYTAEARIVLENQQNYLPGADKTESLVTQQLDAEAVGSQIQILTSRDLARRVIKIVGLQGNPEFDPLADGLGPLDRLLILVGLKRDPTRLSPEDRILESYFDRLTVLSPMKTRVLTIEFSSRNPDLSAKIANTIAEQYLEFQSDAKREHARAAAESLGQLVQDLKTRLAAADARADAFRSQSGLLIGANSTSLNAQQMTDVNGEVAKARASLADAQAKSQMLREMLRQGRIADIPDVMNNELVRRISEQRVTARAQLALESRTLLPAHPRIKELMAQVADLESEIRAAAEKTARSLEAEAKVANARVDNLMKTLEAQKRIVIGAGADEVKMRELDNNVRSLKEDLDSTTTKYQEALAREASKATLSDARIFSRALAPQTASFPKKIPIIAISTLATLVLAIALVAMREFMLTPASGPGNGRRYTWTDEPAATTPVVVDASPEPAKVAAVSRPAFAQADALAHAGLDDVVADIETLGVSSGGLVLSMPVSAGHDDGLALALARRLVSRGRVVLVAGDGGTVTGMTGQVGLAELLDGSAGFAATIHRDGASRLHIIPAGLNSSVRHGDLGAVLDALKGTYDVVVLGVPLAMNDAEAQAMTARTEIAVIGPGDDVAAKNLMEPLAAAGVPHVLRVQTPSQPRETEEVAAA